MIFLVSEEVLTRADSFRADPPWTVARCIQSGTTEPGGCTMPTVFERVRFHAKTFCRFFENSPDRRHHGRPQLEALVKLNSDDVEEWPVNL